MPERKPFIDLPEDEQVVRWQGRILAAERYQREHGNCSQPSGTGRRWDSNIQALAGDFNSREEIGAEAVDVNLMRANAKVVLPPLTLAEPHISVNPTQPRFKNADNIRNAEMTQVELNYWLRELDVRREVQKVAVDGEATNHGYLYVGYTKFKGDSYNSGGERRENVPTIRHAQPFVRRICPKNILVPAGFWDLEECPWVDIKFRKPRREVAEKFDIPLEDLPATKGYVMDSEKDDPRYKEYLDSEDNEYVLVHNIWDKTTKKVYVVAEGYEQYLEEPKAWPWDTEGFPLAHYRPEDIPDEFYGTPPMTYAMPQQKELNATRTAMAKRFRRSKASVFMDADNYDSVAEEYKKGVDGDLYRVEAGQDGNIRNKILVDAGLPPDSQSILYGQQVQADILQIQGVSAEQRGGGDPNVDSATASANIERNVQIRNSDRGDKIKGVYLTIARKLWMILKQFPDQARTRMIAGPVAGALVTLEYTLKELQGEFSFDMDFSAMQQDIPATRATRALLNYKMFRADPLVNPQELILDVYKSQNELTPERKLLFLRNPQEEMQLMLQGLPVEAHERDGHQEHMAQHEQQRDQLTQALQGGLEQVGPDDPQVMKVQLALALLSAHANDHMRKFARIVGAQKQQGDPVGPDSNPIRSDMKSLGGNETAAELNGNPIGVGGFA